MPPCCSILVSAGHWKNPFTQQLSSQFFHADGLFLRINQPPHIASDACLTKLQKQHKQTEIAFDNDSTCIKLCSIASETNNIVFSNRAVQMSNTSMVGRVLNQARLARPASHSNKLRPASLPVRCDSMSLKEWKTLPRCVHNNNTVCSKDNISELVAVSQRHKMTHTASSKGGVGPQTHKPLFAKSSAAAHWCWVTASLYGEQMSIGVFGRAAWPNRAVHWCWVTASLYGEQMSIGVLQWQKATGSLVCRAALCRGESFLPNSALQCIGVG